MKSIYLQCKVLSQVIFYMEEKIRLHVNKLQIQNMRSGRNRNDQCLVPFCILKVTSHRRSKQDTDPGHFQFILSRIPEKYFYCVTLLGQAVHKWIYVTIFLQQSPNNRTLIRFTEYSMSNRFKKIKKTDIFYCILCGILFHQFFGLHVVTFHKLLRAIS